MSYVPSKSCDSVGKNFLKYVIEVYKTIQVVIPDQTHRFIYPSILLPTVDTWERLLRTGQ